jgi:putative transposase
MPWTKVSIVKLREEFVLKVMEPGACMAQLCREAGVSRQTGYKWLRRFRSEGIAGLTDQSRRPRSSRLRVSGEVVLQVLALRDKHGWGPKKLRKLLEKRLSAPDEVPSQRTIARILDRADRTRKRRVRFHPASRPADAPNPTVEDCNDLWTVDFKGWWLAANRERCEPLTVRDAHSRYVLQTALLSSTQTALVRREFERLFTRHGLPRAIQSDNGSPFGSTRALCGLTQLAAWWVSLGIKVVYSRPAHPQDNGGHERVHVDMLGLQERSAPTRQHQQVLCDAWRQEFNHVRPHEALGMKTPAEMYRPSPRKLGAKIVERSYPPGTELVRVYGNGLFRRGKKLYAASRALKGHRIALVPKPGDARMTVWFYGMVLGEIDLEKGNKVEFVTLETCQRSTDATPTSLSHDERGKVPPRGRRGKRPTRSKKATTTPPPLPHRRHGRAPLT